MKNFLYGCFLIILIACFMMLFVRNKCVVESITTFATLLSGLSAFATLYIAILLYDRYGVKSKAKERTQKAIEEMIAEMQKVHFIFGFYTDVKDNTTPRDYIISMSLQSKKEHVTTYFTPAALSSVLYYKKSGILGCSQLFSNAFSNTFLPKNIADAVKKLAVFEFEPQKYAKDIRPITTLSASSDRINSLNDTLDGADTNIPEQRLSVIQFIDTYLGIKDAIVEWYKSNDIDTEDLNLE